MPRYWIIAYWNIHSLFWQWGTSVSTIPSKSATIRRSSIILMEISGPDYFRREPAEYLFSSYKLPVSSVIMAMT